MLTLHALQAGRHGLEDSLVSIGIQDPRGRGVYDFGIGQMVEPEAIIALASGWPARVSFGGVAVAPEEIAFAANQQRAPRFLRRRHRRPLRGGPTGYEEYAADRARFWRAHGVSTQPALAAGVFALSTIQTPITTALKLFTLLTPHVLQNALPPLRELSDIVRAAGAGLDSPDRGRPSWYKAYEPFTRDIADLSGPGFGQSLDDPLRRHLAMEVGLPEGLGLAKLSFTLALLGNDLGCLDARIVEWAFTRQTADRFLKRVSRKRADGTYTEATYQVYRRAELSILCESADSLVDVRDPDDPVELARSQWLLWEALGPEGARVQTHEELFRAVVDRRL